MRRVCLLVAASALIVGCSSGVQDASATFEVFMETCAPGRVPLEVRVCDCTYERIVEALEPDELDDLDRRLRADPDRLPPVVSQAALECAAAPLLEGLPTAGR